MEVCSRLVALDPGLTKAEQDRADILMLKLDRALAAVNHSPKIAVSRRFVEGATNQLVGEHGEIVGDDVINFLIGPDFRHALFHHRVVRHWPFMPGIVHHEIDEDRQQAAEQRGAIPDLGAIDIAVPCRAAMHQLVAQHIKPVEQDREYFRRVMIAQCGA